jgi:hypothetical protein
MSVGGDPTLCAWSIPITPLESLGSVKHGRSGTYGRQTHDDDDDTCLHAGRGLPTRARDFLVHQCAYHKSLKHTHTHIDYVAQSSYLSTYGLLYRSNYYVANRRCASIHHSPYRKQPANSDPYPADTCPSPPIPAYVTMSASTIGGAFVTSSNSGRQCKHRQGWQPWCADSDRGFSIYATSHAGTRTNAADAASPWIRSN